MLTKFDEQAQKAIVVGESIAFDLGHNHFIINLTILECKFYNASCN